MRTGNGFACGTGEEARGDVSGVPRARALGAVLRRAQPRSFQGRRAAPLGGELGRSRPAHARQLRGLPGRGLETEMAGSARRLALGAVLHRLWCRTAEALLRLFSER